MQDSLTQKYVDVAQIDPFLLPSVPLEGRNNLPMVSGIYFAVLQTGEILYIGKAICIKERWEAHHKLEEIRPYKNARIAWFTYPARSDKDLVELEKTCIAHFSPVLNYVTKKQKEDPGDLLIQTLADIPFQSAQVEQFLRLAESQRKKVNQGVTIPESLFSIYKSCAMGYTLKGKKVTMGDLMAKALIKYLVEDIVPELGQS